MIFVINVKIIVVSFYELRASLKTVRILTTELVEVDIRKPSGDSRFDRLNVQWFLEMPLIKFFEF